MMFEDRIDNRTCTTGRAVPARDLAGADVAVVVARLALAFDGEGRLALAARPVRLTDIPDDHGGLMFPSDAEAAKPGTDLGLVGHLAPPGASVTEIVASLRMGPLHKGVRVAPKAQLVWNGKTLGSEPKSKGMEEPVPLVYALCRGGSVPETHETNPLNPLGTGHVDHPSWAGKAAPRLIPFHSEHGPVEHACFAPLPSRFSPRKNLEGTYDAEWSRKRAPLAPADRDPRYASWASSNLHSPKPLAGDEPLKIGGVFGRAELTLPLPAHPTRFAVTILGVRRELPTHLDGVLVDADRQVVELTWRGTFVLPKKLQMVDSIEITTLADLPDEIASAELQGHPEVGS